MSDLIKTVPDEGLIAVYISVLYISQPCTLKYAFYILTVLVYASIFGDTELEFDAQEEGEEEDEEGIK